MVEVLAGQLELFPMLCPTCGVTVAYVGYPKVRRKIVRCTQCHTPVRELSCGCTGQSEEGGLGG